MGMMEIIETHSALSFAIEKAQKQGLSLGFVPTMGALHEGHESLMKRAASENDLTLVSIYVNPKQFNDPLDFEAYPRSLQSDLEILNLNNIDFVFLPRYEELFTADKQVPAIDFMGLDSRLEGASRPGHFKGVVEVVYALFKMIEPTRAYFGLKDFQQVAIIRQMISLLSLPVELVACPTHREISGLARSSRNKRLNDKEKEEALVIYKTLCFIRDNYNYLDLDDLLTQAKQLFRASSLTLDYLAIVDPTTLSNRKNNNEDALACIAAFCGPVRLIDNMPLIAR